VLAQRTLASWKSTAAWAADFATAYNGDITAARAAADNGKPLPGSAAFNKVRDELIGTNNNVKTASYAFNGVRLMDNSSMTHTEGMYNFKEFLPEMVEVVTGASFRRYNLLTEGTIFPKTKDGSEFTINEYGWYMQASSNFKLADEITFKPSAAVRYDKNQYFKGGFTPRVSGVLSLGDHNFRASWQSAFRNPSPNQLLADGNIGEVGGSETAHQAANLYTNKAYTAASVTAYRSSNNLSDLVAYVPNPAAFTTEKIKTWEIGYKSLIANKLYMDVFFYKSNYNDFIATQNYIQPTTGTPADVKNAATSKTYQVNFNNFNEIFVTGYGIGLDYAMGKGWAVSGNYVKQIGDITLKDNAGNIRKDAFGKEIVKRRMSDPVVAQVGRNFFISPEDRCNFTLSNPKLTKNIGLSLAYRWTGKMWVEQGNTQGDIWLPAWNTIDVAVAYKVPSIKTIVKVGASNVLNQYYSQGYGLAQIGGLYYISLNFDQFLN
jgi:outer membrane receptor protein involved in Fe transport